MADSEKKVSYEVDANASGFEGGLQRGAAALRNFSSDAEGQFKKVQDAFGAVQKQLLVLAGIVAGGAFFKDAIAASNQMTGETVKLQKALGITGEEAGTLRTALEDIGSGGDQYVDAFSKFARQLKSNEDGMQRLGIQTRDANGNLRDSKELFTEALGSVGQYKAGLDQTTYAQTLFGKSIEEVRTLQKLNNGVLEEAARKNRELGLIVTQENVEASKKYKLAINAVGDVLTAVKKVIGDAVMPVFTELAEYLASTGPYVVAIFKGAILGLLTAFEVVKGAVKTVAGVVFEVFSTIIDNVGLLSEVFDKLLQGDFSGAYDSATKIGERIRQGVVNGITNFVDAGNEVGDAVKRHTERIFGDKQGAPAPTGGQKRMGTFRDKDTSRVSDWDAELSEQKLAYQEQNNAAGTFYQFQKAQELAFWKDKLALTQAGTAENTAIRKKVAELQLSINQDAYAHELASLQTQETAYKQNMEAKLALLDREAALVRQRYGAESKEFEDVQKKIVDARRQAAEQLQQIDEIRVQSARDAQLSQLQLEAQQAQLQLDLGEITLQQLLQKHAEFEQRRFEIALQGLKDREAIIAADPDRSPVELAKIHAQIEELERQHRQRMTELSAQQVLQATTASRSIANAMADSMQSSLSKMMQGQLTFRSFMQSIWQSLRASVADVLAKMLVDFIKNSVAMAAIKRLLAMFDIGANAAQAGAGAAASAADTPVVGWLLAPLAAAATFAMASAFAGNVPTFSAEGGFDIPGSINPLVQAHEKEMILPARYADVIRSLADQQGGQGGANAAPPAPVNVTFTGHSFGDLFLMHKRELAAALKQVHRDNFLS